MTKEEFVAWMGTKQSPHYKVVQCSDNAEASAVGKMMEDLVGCKRTSWICNYPKSWWKYLFLEDSYTPNAYSDYRDIYDFPFNYQIISPSEFFYFIESGGNELPVLDIADLI